MADWYYVSTTFPYPLLWRFFLSIFLKDAFGGVAFRF